MRKLMDFCFVVGMSTALGVFVSAGCKSDGAKNDASSSGGGADGSSAGGAGGTSAGGAGGTATGGVDGSAAGGTGGSPARDAAAGAGGAGGDAGSLPRDGAAGAGGAAPDASSGKLASSTGTWVVYPVMPSNPAMGIKGTVDVFDSGNNRTRFVLMVSGLPPNMTFGSHVHVLSCAEMEAGGHYQHMLPPDGGTAASVANPANEVWLDFTTNSAGNGNSMATVDWRPRAGQAKSVVVHAMQTADGGTAGTKLACTNISL